MKRFVVTNTAASNRVTKSKSICLSRWKIKTGGIFLLLHSKGRREKYTNYQLYLKHENRQTGHHRDHLNQNNNTINFCRFHEPTVIKMNKPLISIIMLNSRYNFCNGFRNWTHSFVVIWNWIIRQIGSL